MTQARKIQSIVEKVLKENPSSRESYNVLFVCMLREFGCDLDSSQQKALLEMPSPLSIDRAARKIWETHQELRPSKATQRKRKYLQEEYRKEYKRPVYVFEPDGVARIVS